MSVSFTTSATTSPKVGHFDNMSYDNWQSANAHPLVSSLSAKLVSSNKISSGKVDESTFCMMPKATFVKKVNNNYIDFELVSCNCIRKANRFFAGDN